MLYIADSQALGERIRSARKARGWTNQRLAHEAHVAQGTVTRIERGQGAHRDNVEAVLRALNLENMNDYPPGVWTAMVTVGEWLMSMTPDELPGAMLRLGQLVGSPDPLHGATRRERQEIVDAHSDERKQ